MNLNKIRFMTNRNQNYTFKIGDTKVDQMMETLYLGQLISFAYRKISSRMKQS